jgi:regulator of RNase E activity RraB
MSAFPTDPDRLAAELEADVEVLDHLAANGDRADIVRAIDVSFRGPQDALDALVEQAADHGFVFLEFEEDEDGYPCAYFEIQSPVDRETITALTTQCLQIEAQFGVEYDGWGCTAETGKD